VPLPLPPAPGRAAEFPMAPETPSGIHGQPSNRAIMLILAYLPPFAVIPLLVEKTDADLQWHAKHGIVLMTAEMLLLLGLVVAALVFGLMTAGIGCALIALVPIPFLVFLVMHIVAVVRAFGGRRLIIPVVSEYADRF
jgi:uncharacterized membrane protein